MERLLTGPTAPSVLVVDADPDTADSLVEILAYHGYAARTAGSAEEALRDPASPDAVILDVRLPGMDGWDLARRLRGRAKPPLVVAVTGCGRPADRARSAEAGVHLHLLKPVEPGVIVGVLGRFRQTAAAGPAPVSLGWPPAWGTHTVAAGIVPQPDTSTPSVGASFPPL